MLTVRPGGGTGRHGGLKPPSPQGGAGSIPAPGTFRLRLELRSDVFDHLRIRKESCTNHRPTTTSLSSMRARSVRAAVLLTAASLLVACGSGAEAASAPSITRSTRRPAPSTTVSPPAVTDAASITDSSTVVRGSDASAPADPTTDWSKDLDVLDSTVRLRHPEPFWKTDEATWRARTGELRALLPTLDDEHAKVELIKLVALLDTHSGISPEEVGFHFYPFALYEFSDGMFVVNADDPSLVGSRLVSVGGTPIADAIDAITPLVNGDNDSGILYLRSWFMIRAECLHAVGVTSELDRPAFVFERNDGTTTTLDPSPISVDDLVSTLFAQGVALFVNDPKTTPEAVARRGEPVWWRVDAPTSTFLLSYNETGTDVSEALQKMTAALDDGSATRVVLDMRYAQGGSFAATGKLRDALAQDMRLQQPGALTVMIGRENVSAGTGLASWLDANTPAVFVGEPTPARPNPPVDEETFTLPDSGITVHIPTGQIVIDDTDTRPAVMPDVSALASAADFFAGLDPVLQGALAGAQE